MNIQPNNISLDFHIDFNMWYGCGKNLATLTVEAESPLHIEPRRKSTKYQEAKGEKIEIKK